MCIDFHKLKLSLGQNFSRLFICVSGEFNWSQLSIQSRGCRRNLNTRVVNTGDCCLLQPSPSYRRRINQTALVSYFFFSFFNFRFSFKLSLAFFWPSLLPLSFLPLSPISFSPCLKMSCVGRLRPETVFGRGI